MGKAHSPRSGSMQFWPRVRAKREYARIRNPNVSKKAILSAFSGYKVGMTHIIIIDNKKTSHTKGEQVALPVTVVECPPIKIIGLRFYKKTYDGMQVYADIFSDKYEKEILKKTKLPKKSKESLEKISPDMFENMRLIVHTKPKLTGISKKKPEIFEIAIGGSKEEKLNYAKENLGKDVNISDVFKEGQQLSVSGITKGKGYQGPVKRFGVDIRHHKSEKTIRGPGSLGGWKGQGHVMYRIAYAGKMGYHQRKEYNKQLLKISDKPEEINIKGGYKRYGVVKETYILIKGSIPGPSKRMLIFTDSKRPSKKITADAPSIENINLESNQGR